MSRNLSNRIVFTTDSYFHRKLLCLHDLIILFKSLFNFCIIKGITLDKQKISKLLLDFELFYTLTPKQYLNKVLKDLEINESEHFIKLLEVKGYGEYYSNMKFKSEDELRLDARIMESEYIINISKFIIQIIIDNHFKSIKEFQHVTTISYIPKSINENTETDINLDELFDITNKWIVHEKISEYIIIKNDSNKFLMELISI